MVSIHSRPEDRLQLTTSLSYNLARVFQSTAGPKTGCNDVRDDVQVLTAVFQSTAGPKTGCNLTVLTAPPPHTFQSTAGPKTGCNKLTSIRVTCG